MKDTLPKDMTVLDAIEILIRTNKEQKEKLRDIQKLNIPNLLRSLVHEDLIDNGEAVIEAADQLQEILDRG